MFYDYDDSDFTYSTETDWDNAEAFELGERYPDRCWICTDRDVWHKNPFYKGPEEPHPESCLEELEDWANWAADPANQPPVTDSTGAELGFDPDDDLPF